MEEFIVSQIFFLKEKKERLFQLIFFFIDKSRTSKKNVTIHINSNAISVYRDLLISISQLAFISQQTNIRYNYIISLSPNADSKTIISSFFLLPYPPDICIRWKSDDTSFNTVLSGYENDVALSFNPELKTDCPKFIKIIEDISSGKCQIKSYLEPSLCFQTFARNIIRQHYHNVRIITLDLEIFQFSEEQLFKFFSSFYLSTPKIHFFLLNDYSPTIQNIASNVINITSTKIQGFSFLQECALVLESDIYIGEFNKYASLVIGTKKSFLIKKIISSGDLMNLYQIIQKDNAELNQYWMRSDYSLNEIYQKLISMVMDN